MAVETELKELIINRYGTLKNFVDQADLKYTTMDSILKRGVNKANVQHVIKICDALNIDVKELASGRITPNASIEASTTNRDFTHLKHYYALFSQLDGKKLTDDEVEFLSDGVDVLVEQIRKKRSKSNSFDKPAIPLKHRKPVRVTAEDLIKGRVVKVDLTKDNPIYEVRVASPDKPKIATRKGSQVTKVRRSRHEDS